MSNKLIKPAGDTTVTTESGLFVFGYSSFLGVRPAQSTGIEPIASADQYRLPVRLDKFTDQEFRELSKHTFDELIFIRINDYGFSVMKMNEDRLRGF